MREVIVVCRSTKRARDRVARILDRYFWRIADRTWRGRASNACLDRVSRELRRRATRNTAVAFHEIRSAHASRIPLIRIGSRYAYSPDGLAPVATHETAQWPGAIGGRPPAETCAGAVVRTAALFHDLGKAMRMFQDKLRRALDGGPPQADPVRHELHSAAVWDELFATTTDDALPDALEHLDPRHIDEACRAVTDRLVKCVEQPDSALPLHFASREGSLVHLIGMLILTHHRMPDGDSDHLTLLANRHAGATTTRPEDLAIAPGTPFWHEDWWRRALARSAGSLIPDTLTASPDIALRASLMFADHVASAQKKPSDRLPDHLANTATGPDGYKPVPADDLGVHVRRVYRNAKPSFDVFHRYRDRFPALDEGQIPADVMHPHPTQPSQFLWQPTAAQQARSMCSQHEGGFFACLMAATGTGKTRAAPTILANAAIGDARPERRYLRMNLGLGLRVLATQSAREYVTDLGFRDEDVSVIVGESPIEFVNEKGGQEVHTAGSESLIELPEWLRVEYATGGVPPEGDERESDWLRSLSADTERSLPAFCERILEHAGHRAATGRRLLAPPILVSTVDQLMDVAAPVTARYLIPSLRVATGDLILDEIDQFDGEDIAAIGRLVFQTAAAGRRVIIISATLPRDVAHALYTAYARGWSEFAASSGVADHVNLLCTGDTPESCCTNEDGRNLGEVIDDTRAAILDGLSNTTPVRRGEILPACNDWSSLVDQIDAACSQLHADNAIEIEGYSVSVGMIRMTRIAHTAALAAQMPSGCVNARLRVLVCLHSQFPRLHREWIEHRLGHALSRKAPAENDGVRALCHSQRLFERATQLGTREIEIVVVTSPVIETGNDLDFDYAIVDPASIRSIIHASGRVRRHRSARGSNRNVLILGRSPVAMQQGCLAMPGVETPISREVGVPRQKLDQFPGRAFTDLAGTETFHTIDAGVLFATNRSIPLRDAEDAVRIRMIRADTDGATTPLGRYTQRLNARLNRAMTRTRRFRRSEARHVIYQMVGDDLNDAEWYVDLAPGTRHSALRDGQTQGLICSIVPGEHLFDEMTPPAWFAHSGGQREMTAKDLQDLMWTEIPDYDDDVPPKMTYTPFTGFTRGRPEDLFQGYGMKTNNQ